VTHRFRTCLIFFLNDGRCFENNSRELWAVGLRTPEDFEWVGSALEPFVRNGILTFESALQRDEPLIGPPHNKSLAASGGSVFRIMTDPAVLD
jgi:hypothetical protein